MKTKDSLHLVVFVAAGLLLAGCAGGPPKAQEEVQRVVADNRTDIGWIKRDWRVCIEDETCPKPTPKTVVLTPVPAVVPAAQPSVKVDERRLPIIVYFEFAKAKPTEGGVAELNRLAGMIRPTDVIHIEGYTDDLGEKGYNDRLARSRAEYVAGWLKKKGIKNAVKIKASGKCCYAVPNDSEAQRALNRRAEVRFSNSTDKE